MSPQRSRRAVPWARVAALTGFLALALPPREACAVVPGLAPVGFAILPQALLLAGYALLFLVRPRTWIRAVAFLVRHPLRSLAIASPVAAVAALATLWALKPGPATAAPEKPPAPPSALFGPAGGPNQSFASDFRAKGVLGPVLEPDVRWIREAAGAGAILAAAGRLVARDRATLSAWDLKTGAPAWKVALGRSDGFDPILLGRHGPLLASDGRLRDLARGRPAGSVPGLADPRAAVFRDGILAVLGERSIQMFDARQASDGIVVRTGRVPTPVPGPAFRMVLDEQSRLFVSGGGEIAGLDLADGGRTYWRRKLWGVPGPPTCAGGWVFAAVPGPEGEPNGIVRLDPEDAGERAVGEPDLTLAAKSLRLAASREHIAVPSTQQGRPIPGGSAFLSRPSSGSSPRVRPSITLLDVRTCTIVRTIALPSAFVQPLVASDTAAYGVDEEGVVTRVSFEKRAISWSVPLGSPPTGPMLLCDGALLVPTRTGVAILED